MSENIKLPINSMKNDMSSTGGKIDMSSITASGTAFINSFSTPVRLEVIEFPDKIEMIYEETLNFVHTGLEPKPPHKIYFKIIFSCVNGEWNKSERIYGKKIESESYFEFD